MNRIEQAFLILRDKYRNGEDLPDLVEDIFPKEEAELTALRKKLAQMEAEQSQLSALKRELWETKAALKKAKRELEAYRAKKLDSLKTVVVRFVRHFYL